jgi:hypothetical protein
MVVAFAVVLTVHGFFIVPPGNVQPDTAHPVLSWVKIMLMSEPPGSCAVVEKMMLVTVWFTLTL